MIIIDVQSSPERKTDLLDNPLNKEIARKVVAHWKEVVESNKPITANSEKPARPEEEIREEMGALGRAIEDHPNLYAAFTVAGVFLAMYGLSSNIVGNAETNLALARAVTNLTQYL